MGGKRKASTFTDEERADAVALLIMQGWPEKKGALTSVANHLNIWPRTLSRWAKGESNPPPDKIVTNKKSSIVDLIEHEMRAIFGAMGASRDDATYQQLGTVFGILTDKRQLLTGGPTENINQRVLVLDFGDSPNGNGNGRAVSD